MPRPNRLLLVPLGIACGVACAHPTDSGSSSPEDAALSNRELVDDFERTHDPKRWAFSAGEEFPGAAGRFEKSGRAAHTGEGGGQLDFDFTAGGAYVAAVYMPERIEQPESVRAWIRNPGANGLTFRYMDQTGQVLQKPFEVTADAWSDVTIGMDSWEMHFGGADDGEVHGPPLRIAFVVRNDGPKQGRIDLDDVRLVSRSSGSSDRPEGQDTPRSGGVLVEDFERAHAPERWAFSAGEEFPGAAGRFEKVASAAHAGEGGGRLGFDFNAGGVYVAAVYIPEQVPQPASVRVWIRNPGGNGLKFRYLDRTGQVLQKPFRAAADTWSEVTIDLDAWDMHFGGANDGVVHGPPARIAFLVMNDGQKQGHVDLDDVRLVPPRVGAANGLESSTYVAARWQDEGWSMRAHGNGGRSSLRGSVLVFDFSQGASAIELRAPEGSLLGKPEELRIRVRGTAPGHALRLRLATHLMTFERSLGQLTGDGMHELIVPAPPGEGWTWFGGENDGKLHGPLRIESLLLDRGDGGHGRLELVDVRVKTGYAPRRSLIMLAGTDAQDRVFEAELRNLSRRATTGDLDWVIRDWDGRAIRQGRSEVTVPPLAESLTVPVRVPDGDHLFLEAEFSFRSDDGAVAPTRACYVASTSRGREPRLDKSSPFGMGVYLYRNLGQPDEMERLARLAQRASVTWTREVFRWTLVEPAKGEFDWTAHDRMVATAKRHGLSVFGVLCYWAPWTEPYTPEGIADYCRYAEAIARHYREDIQHWEIWNEPNIFFWQGPRDMYAELLDGAYAAIKRANPAAKVLGCSAAGVDPRFIERTLQLGASFDILTIHPYRGVLDDIGFIEELQRTAALARPPDGAPRPIWITEMGWSTQAAHPWTPREGLQTTQRQQAELLARSYIDALASSVTSNIAWYDFRDDGPDPFYGEQNMGVMTHDLRPKPAYRAFATVASLLEGRRVDRRLTLGDGVIAFRFVGAEGTSPVVAFWSTEKPRIVALPADRPATLVDLMGRDRPLAPVDGELRLQARPGCPSFVVLD